MERENNSKQTGYKKIRYYLVTENVFIVLAFLLIAVGAYNFWASGFSYWVSYIYICAGIILFVVGLIIAIKMVKAFQRNDIPAYVNIFATLLPKDIELDENLVKSEFEDKIKVINTHLIVIWDKLTLREQYIIISLIDGPLKRNEIAKTLNVTTGSISKPLVNLQHQELVILENNSYYLSEPILKRWLELEFNEKGIYPYRNI